MIDQIAVARLARQKKLSDAAESILREYLELAPSDVRGWERATIDVSPQPGVQIPVRPFLHRGDWMDDGQGTQWTIVTALLDEDIDGREPYLWHAYEAVKGTHRIT